MIIELGSCDSTLSHGDERLRGCKIVSIADSFATVDEVLHWATCLVVIWINLEVASIWMRHLPCTSCGIWFVDVDWVHSILC